MAGIDPITAIANLVGEGLNVLGNAIEGKRAERLQQQQIDFANQQFFYGQQSDLLSFINGNSERNSSRTTTILIVAIAGVLLLVFIKQLKK